MLDLISLLSSTPVMPVLTIEHVQDAPALANALARGGLRVVEVTLRTAAALESITAIREASPDVIVGAGTILNPQDLAAAQAAGAVFAVSPGQTSALLEAGKKSGIPLLPGVASASDVMAAKAAGYSCMKFFPAEAMGGIATLKSFAGPFSDVRFCPTGGIDAAKAPSYRALSNVLCVGGSWMVPGDAVKSRDWAKIEALTKASVS